MQENIKISKMDKKETNYKENPKFLLKKCNWFISFGQMTQNEST